MLTLVLLRHAKAEASRGDDFARALTDKGRADAARLGTFLLDHSIGIDLALVSTARRTAETADLVLEGTTVTRRDEQPLYNAEADGLLRRVQTLEPSTGTLLLVAHNPGVMDLASDLAAAGDATEISRLRGRFPPCACAVLTFASEDWRDACASGGRLDALVFPEDLAEEV